MAKKNQSQAENPKNEPINIFFDPDTGLITIDEQVYQLRHAASGTKLQFNTKGELSR